MLESCLEAELYALEVYMTLFYIFQLPVRTHNIPLS